jgi:hypothetical protein
LRVVFHALRSAIESSASFFLMSSSIALAISPE